MHTLALIVSLASVFGAVTKKWMQKRLTLAYLCHNFGITFFHGLPVSLYSLKNDFMTLFMGCDFKSIFEEKDFSTS